MASGTVEVWLLMLGMDEPDMNTVVSVHGDFYEARRIAHGLNEALLDRLPADWIFHVAGPYNMRLTP